MYRNAARAAAAIAISFIICLSSVAFADSGSDFGVAFTNPEETFPMPKEWEAQGIKYEDWASGADISVSLEQDVYQTILPMIEKYARDNKLKIAVKEGTCGIAAGALAKKTTDIGGFCCPAGREDRFAGLKYHTLGIVSIVFLVHPGNPVEGLTSAKLRDIYNGKLNWWSQIKDASGKPGPNWNIKAVARLHCPKRPGHWRLMIDGAEGFGARVIEVGSIPDMISSVAGNKDAIGWEVLSMVAKYGSLGKVKELDIDGLSPHDTDALASGAYPFYRVYNITTWTSPTAGNKKADQLVEYLKSEMRNIDPAKFGFVSAERLRKAGWRFTGEELTGGPAKR